MKIDRRRLLRLGISAGVLASLPLATVRATDSTSTQMLQVIDDTESPIEKSVTGRLSQNEFNQLATLCQFVDQTWELGTDLNVYLGQLRSDLDLMTSRTPSYLGEYRHALDLIQLVFEASENIEESWTTLLFAEFDVDNFASTKLGRARRHVFSPIVTHQIPISGAFKNFGLVNYRGYFGGPYASPASYRRGAI